MQEVANEIGRNPDFLLVLAQAYLDIIKHEAKALKIYQEIVDSFPTSEAAIEATVGLVWREKNIDKAIQMCEHVLERDSDNTKVMEFLSYRYQHMSDYKNIDRAKELLEKLHELDPNNPVHCENLARLYAEEEIDLDRAILFGKKTTSLAMNPKLPDASLFSGPQGPPVTFKYPKHPYGLALAYFKKKMYEKAEKEVLGLIEESRGRHPPALMLLADCCSQTGRYDKAMSTYLKILAEDQGYKKVKDKLESLYVKKYGSKEGFDKFLHDGLVEAGVIRSAPDFTLKDLHGNTISLSDYEGKVIVLNI